MQTQLNYKAYLSGALFVFIPFFAWIGVSQVNTSVTNQITSLLALVHLVCWGAFLYTFFMEYWQYECTDENLIITNIVTKSKKIVPLKSISNVELTRHQLKNGHYHNIKLTLTNEILILKGIYIENVEGFFDFLKSKI